ncbi:transglutaminase family protein [Roseimaritima ulvae]|nr:transglutaminase family protein [Roseimaritima ulvae]
MIAPAPSARYRIAHTTLYRYSTPVAICHNQLRMLPRAWNGVQIHSSEVDISPTPTWRAAHTDYYQNKVLTFAIESLHTELKVSVVSDVTVNASPDLSAHPTEWKTVQQAQACPVDDVTLAASEYRYESPMVIVSAPLADYARPSFDKFPRFMDALTDLTKRIHADFRYDTRATNVTTKADEAFQLRAGVCQDFAHVQIGCLRSLGFAARYVSGYLRTIPKEGEEKLVGADESHAWLSVYGGPELGWVDCDPTNACLVYTDHIPICIGRDYRDVSPMRGVAIGGGRTSLSVSVDVSTVES